MEALAVLMLISLIVAAGFLIAFLRMVNRGGLDDLVSPSVKMLGEDSDKASSGREKVSEHIPSR